VSIHELGALGHILAEGETSSNWSMIRHAYLRGWACSSNSVEIELALTGVTSRRLAI
jgi:hypothetical protein